MKKNISLIIFLLFFCCKKSESMNINLSNGRSISCFDVDMKKFNLMDKKEITSLIIKSKYPEIKLYDVKGIGIVAIQDDYVTGFDNIKDCEDFIMDYEKRNGSEILFGLNPYGENFVVNSKRLSDEILNNINYKGSANEQLSKIDDFINKNPNYKSNKYLINYIAIIGNVLLKKYGGAWELELASDNVTWNPYLKIKGKRYDLITYVYEDVIINRNSSLLLSYQSLCDIIENNSKATQ